VQTKRLTASFHALTRSVALTELEKLPSEATCVSVLFFLENPQKRPDAKVLTDYKWICKYVVLRSEKPKRHVRKALHCGSKQQHSSPDKITLLLIVRATYIWCCSLHMFRSWWTAHSAQCQPSGCNNIPSFLQWTTPIAHSFCAGFTQDNLHILVTAPFCCDRKSRSGIWAKLRTVAGKQQHSSPNKITLILLVRTTYIWCCYSRTFRLWWTSAQGHTQRKASKVAATVARFSHLHTSKN